MKRTGTPVVNSVIKHLCIGFVRAAKCDCRSDAWITQQLGRHFGLSAQEASLALLLNVIT